MIKIFRHIRHRLIRENKIGRYFKYAIGEILLVVIGILIALQINNWNENRKLLKQAQNYRNTIVNDLVLDTLSINALLKRVTINKKIISDYFSHLEALEPSSSNIKPLLDSISNLQFYYMKYFPVNNSFKQMTSTANGDLLSKKQRDFLLDLLAEQEEIAIITQSQLIIARENKNKSDALTGLPKNIYEKLNSKNTAERQIQAIIHLNLWIKAVDDLYLYLDERGKKIKNMINENIHLFHEHL